MVSGRFTVMAALAAGLTVTGTSTFGNTQEFTALVESGAGATAQTKTVTVFHVSHDVSPGTIEMFDPHDKCVFMINDAFVTRAAFLRAVTPGKRLYCRGNRHAGQFYGVYTTPFFTADGPIGGVSWTTVEVTHKPCYIMCTPETVTQTVAAVDGVVIRYEGRDVIAEEAFKVGRHLRAVAPRKQIVQALSADARVHGIDELRATFPAAIANEGFLAGVSGNTDFFASVGPDGCTDALQAGPKEEPSWLLDGQYVPRGAALRRGDRALLCPDQIVNSQTAYKVFQVGSDEQVVEGVVKSRTTSSLTLEVTECPTGLAANCTKRDVTVALDADAEYHLNGVTGYSSGKPVDETLSFRYLRFTVLEGESGLGRGIAEIRYLVGAGNADRERRSPDRPMQA